MLAAFGFEKILVKLYFRCQEPLAPLLLWRAPLRHRSKVVLHLRSASLQRHPESFRFFLEFLSVFIQISSSFQSNILNRSTLSGLIFKRSMSWVTPQLGSLFFLVQRTFICLIPKNRSSEHIGDEGQTTNVNNDSLCLISKSVEGAPLPTRTYKLKRTKRIA